MASSAVQAVKDFIAAINRRDAAALAELMAEDHTFVDSQGTTVSGRENMAAGWAEYFRLFPDYAVQVETIVHDKGLVALFGSAAGTYSGRRGPVPENRIEMPAAWKAVVEKGRVKLWQVYADWSGGQRIIAEDAKRG